jgi:hypothetical protein
MSLLVCVNYYRDHEEELRVSRDVAIQIETESWLQTAFISENYSDLNDRGKNGR